MVLGTSAGWTGHLAKAVHQAKVDHQGQGSHLTRLHIWKWSEMHNGIFPDLYLTSPSSSETKLILRFFLRPELFLRSENFFLGPEFVSQYQKVFPGTRNFSWDQKTTLRNLLNILTACLRIFSWECSVELQLRMFRMFDENVQLRLLRLLEENVQVSCSLWRWIWSRPFLGPAAATCIWGPGCASWGLCKKPFSARLSSLNETSHPLCVQKHSLNTLQEGY